ncbi:hypothetical protein CWM47_02495 [Spirosoma pollinicola]|uniref:Uncharacterized protein n=1 Tax=Spirosoma pollinicola TaxID=2057025 RepID=A0A2K8YT22_9BACT|nr:hypothetical protein CWM47_02495 [Spirosoma pollinicola]
MYETAKQPKVNTYLNESYKRFFCRLIARKWLTNWAFQTHAGLLQPHRRPGATMIRLCDKLMKKSVAGQPDL